MTRTRGRGNTGKSEISETDFKRNFLPQVAINILLEITSNALTNAEKHFASQFACVRCQQTYTNNSVF